MSVWRQGRSVPHHVYRQTGDGPDVSPWPYGDHPVATFMDPNDALRAVEAVNGALTEDSVGIRAERDALRDELRNEVQRRDDLIAELRQVIMVRDRQIARARQVERMIDRDPVILASHADHLLHEQVRAVLDEEGVEGLADAIRRVAREAAQ